MAGMRRALLFEVRRVASVGFHLDPAGAGLPGRARDEH